MQRKLYQHLASRVQAMTNCKKTGNSEWLAKHRASIDWLVKEYMPSGSGIDTGTFMYTDQNTKLDRLVFSFSYHHMNDGGMYDGWTDHQAIITPSFDGIDIRITGYDRNDVKEYLYQVFESALTQEIDDAQEEHLKAVEAA